jgi:hypothetical protein
MVSKSSLNIFQKIYRIISRKNVEHNSLEYFKIRSRKKQIEIAKTNTTDARHAAPCKKTAKAELQPTKRP